LVGDIERLIAELWPFRVPIAIGLIVVLAVIGYAGWRHGWHRVALAHPRTTALVIVLILAIGGPIGWVLGSPLFIRTELVEEAPVADEGSTSAVLLEGEFVGADDFHFGSGRARLIEIVPGELVLHFDGFSVQNGPDLFVYLSPDPTGWTEEAVNLGELKATDGSFSYQVPLGIDPADVGSVVIWCRAFSVLFATAALHVPAA
jgi:hypothetical protein